jgi:SAM-dependent methyltransferase
MDFTEFVLSQLPPPARVLELGCGAGRLAHALAAAGYDVLAIDPVAPEGALFRRVTLEELEDPGPFDAVVAQRSLHHLHDLGAALDRVHALLRPKGGGAADWAAEHQGLHGYDALHHGLVARFGERAFSWEPYLYQLLGGVASEDLERTLIGVGAIQPLGFRWVGVRD